MFGSNNRTGTIVLVTGTIVLLAVVLWVAVHPRAAAGPANAPSASEITLFPGLDGLSGDMALATEIIAAQSGPVHENDGERELTFVHFDPKITPQAVLRSDRLPADLGALFVKKRAWWPDLDHQKVKVSGGLDAAVARFAAGTYIIQTAESRAQFVAVIREREGLLDLTLSEPDGLPRCVEDCFAKNLFVGATAAFKRQARWAGCSVVAFP